MEAKLVRDDAPPDEFIKPAHVISGLHCYHLDMQSHVPHTESKMCQVIIHLPRNTQEVQFNGFTVGSILILRYMHMCMCMPVYVYVCMCLIKVIEFYPESQDHYNVFKIYIDILKVKNLKTVHGD